MANEPGTLELLARELSRALSPLVQRLQEGDAKRFINSMGLDVPNSSITPALDTAFRTTATAADVLPEMLEELIAAIEAGNTTEMLSLGAQIAQQAAAMVDAAQTIADGLDGTSIVGVSPAEMAAFTGELAERVSELVLVEYLEGFYPLAHSILSLFGVVEVTRENVGSANLQLMEHDRKRLRLERVGTLLSDPGQLVEDLYGWGTGAFDGALLLRRLAALFRALGLPIAHGTRNGLPVIEFSVLSITPTGAVPAPDFEGLDATVTLGLADGFELVLPIAPGLDVELTAGGGLDASAGARLLPPAKLSVIPPSGEAQGQLGLGIVLSPTAPSPTFTILGVAGGTGLFAERIRASLLAGFVWSGAEAQGDLGFEAAIEGGKLRIGMDGADGFLADILAGISVEADFDVSLAWTAGTGLRFNGSHSLSVQLPAHIDLGPVSIDGLTLTIGVDGATIPIALATDIAAQLGPLSASVEQIGAEATLSFPSGGGNIGPVQLDLAFKPPTGAGLALDAGAVSGGGYLFFDPDNGEYGGALELNLMEIVEVKAIGLISTRMPDGTEGFSLLIVITAEFGSGLQLGFGFTLLGVGGILGLHRSMNQEALTEGVATGSIDNVMFPTDVIANAQQIIADLKKYFPVELDVFVVGPLAKLGWGTPTLVSLSLGVVIEIPPGNIAILGVLKAALPDEDAALLVLQVSFIGAVEFDKERAWFFASLFGSRVLFLTIEGDMGLLIGWGDDANFVVSVGGFHPSYQPPPLPFPVPRRVAVMILNESWGRIRVEGYFAVTSNTAQFGAKLDIYFGFSAFSLEGYLALDALFQFSPFYFIVQISGKLALSAAGLDLLSVQLSFTLEGPTPWRAKGKGKVKLLFFSISANFDETWGDAADTSLPPIEVMPLLEAEYAKEENWVALPPASQSLSVSLRELPETDALVLHPVGNLRVSQRAVPLEIDIDKVGNQSASDAKRFSVSVTSAALGKKGDTEDSFATGQYVDLSDGERLSRRGYEHEKSGLEIGAKDADLGVVSAVTRTVRYELVIIDNNFKRFVKLFHGLFTRLFGVLLKRNAVALSALSFATKSKAVPFADKTEVLAGSYAVAFKDDNRAFDGQAVSFTSQAQAERFLGDLAPEDASSVHVIETYEVNRAA